MILTDISDWFILTGRLHPLIVHLPIGIIVLAGLFELLSLFKKYAHLRQGLNIFWLCASLSATFACVAGWLLAQNVGYDENELFIHQWLGIGVAVISILFYLLKQFSADKKYLHSFLALVSVIVLSAAGHYGGTLTHGEEFLNEPLQAVLGIESSSEKRKVVYKPIDNIEEAVTYQDLVLPILEQKCFKCHNSTKQKGDLRLDSYDHIVKGGKNGSTLVAGSAEKSELYKRLLLPIEDKHRMPPKNKTQLTKHEIELIHWWIQEGNASADNKVAEMLRPEHIKVVLAGFTQSGSALSATESENEFSAINVSEATESSLKPLIDYGLSVNRLAVGSPLISVNCVNVENFNDTNIALLLNVKEQIVWLRMGNTKITDGSTATLSKLTRLTRLSLEYTAITDQGLNEIKKLPELQYLNLVGTKISDAAITSLSGCKKLKSVYLWQTNMTPNGISALRNALPDTEINFGE